MTRKKKIIAVVGATGAQGGGLANAILSDSRKRFQVRAITRSRGSDNAMALAERGAELVKANLDDVESLVQAFEGAYGAFCVTNFWEHMSPEREFLQARNMADAAMDAGVEHVIWSTLEDTRRWVPLDDDRMPTLMGKYKVPHFDAKGEANEEFVDRDVPTTFLLTSFYWDNFIHFGMQPKRDADGTLTLTLPLGDEPMPGMAAADIGKCAFGIFERDAEFIGSTVGIAGEHLTGEQMAAGFTRALGEKVVYQAIDPATYRGFGFPGADDLGNMFQFYRDFAEEFCGSRDLKMARELNPELLTFDDWLALHKNQLPVEQAVP